MFARPIEYTETPITPPSENPLQTAAGHIAGLADRLASTAARAFFPLAGEGWQALTYHRLITAVIVRLADLLDCDVSLAQRTPTPAPQWWEKDRWSA